MNIIRQNGDWNYVISKNFVHSKGLSRDARFLFILLQSYIGPNSDEPYPSNETLMEVMGYGSPETLNKYKNELKAGGYLTVTQQRYKGKYKKNIYTLHPKGGGTVSNNKDSGENRGLNETEPSTSFSDTEKTETEKTELGNLGVKELPLFEDKPSTVKTNPSPKSGGEGVYNIRSKDRWDGQTPIDYGSFVETFNRVYGLTGLNRVRVTEKKRRQIRGRLNSFTGYELALAMIGRARSEFMNSGEGRKYRNDFSNLFQNDDKPEHWLKYYGKTKEDRANGTMGTGTASKNSEFDDNLLG